MFVRVCLLLLFVFHNEEENSKNQDVAEHDGGPLQAEVEAPRH